MNKYDPPLNEEMIRSYFISKKRIKKKLLEFIAFEKNKRIFVNSELLGTNGLLCAMSDGITMMKYEKNSPHFIDSQWIIDEKIGCDLWKEIKRLTDELRENKSLWKKLDVTVSTV